MVIGQYENHNDTLGYQIAILWVPRILQTWTDRDERMAKFRGIILPHTWVITAIASVAGTELWNQCVFCQEHWTFLSSRDLPAIESEEARTLTETRAWWAVAQYPLRTVYCQWRLERNLESFKKKSLCRPNNLSGNKFKKWGLIFHRT